MVEGSGGDRARPFVNPSSTGQILLSVGEATWENVATAATCDEYYDNIWFEVVP